MNEKEKAAALAWADFNKCNWDHHMQISKPVFAEILNNWPRTPTKKAMDDYSLKLVDTQNLKVTKPEDGDALAGWQEAYDSARITSELMQADFKEKLIDALPDPAAQMNLVNGIKGCYDSYPKLAPFIVPGAKAAEEEMPGIRNSEAGGVVWSYVLHGEEAEIISASGTKGRLEIPTELDGYKVSSIGDRAFAGCSGITEIVLPEGLRSVGIGAFYRCRSLKLVRIPESVEKIWPGAFAYCTALEEIETDENNRAYRSYNGALYSADLSVLEVCPAGIKKLSMAGTAEKIERWAFAGCVSLESVYLSVKLKEIGDHAFFDCFSLERIIIPESVETIGESAFSDCHSLKDTVLLPKRLKRLGDSAFWHCASLTRMVIPDGIGVLEDNVFELCTDLREIVFPKALKKIGKTAFVFCGSLKELNVPEGVISIGKAAFEYCAGLERLTLPSTLTEIKVRAFASCGNLKFIDVSPENACFRSEGGVLYSKDGKTLVAYPGGIAVGRVCVKDGVGALGEACFKGSGELTELVLPDSVREIGLSAFWRCGKLSRVELGKGLEVLGNDAFMDCGAVTELTLPESLKKIGDWTFWNCTGLKTLAIPAGVEHIGLGTFLHCDALESIDVAKENKNYACFDGAVYTKDFEMLIDCPAGKRTLTVNGNTKKIGRYGVLGCGKLEKISLPEGLEYIDDWAFDGCRSLPEILIPQSVSFIGDFTFYDCESLRSAVLPENTGRIGVCMFENTGLESYALPKNAERIERYAFLNCRKLRTLDIPESVSFIGRDAFYGCVQLKRRSKND